MQRRSFLAALAWLATQAPGWPQPDRVQQLAQLLVGEPVANLPQEVQTDLHKVLQRLPVVTESNLEQVLIGWPEGQQSCRRALSRLLDPWRVCDFANRPGHPPSQAADWSRPWPG